MKFNKNEITELLQKQIIQINFKKVDGTNRKMICTLKADILTKKQISQNSNEKAEKKEGIMVVWDLEKDSFRSFRLENLIDYTIIQEGFEL